MAKSRVKRASRKKPLNLPSFLPGMRGHAQWHVREVRPDETPHTLNVLGSTAEMAIPLDNDPVSQYTVIHEMLHAAHSPVEAPRSIIGPDKQVIDKEWLLIAEELRIELLQRVLVGEDQIPDMLDELYATGVDKLRAASANDSPPLLVEFVKWAVLAQFMHPDYIPTYSWITSRLAIDQTQNLMNHDAGYYAGKLVQSVLDLIAVTWEDSIAQMHETGEPPSWDDVIHLAQVLQTALSPLMEMSSLIPQNKGSSSIDSDGDLIDPDLKGLARYAAYADEPMQPSKDSPPASINEMRRRINDMLKVAGGTPSGQGTLLIEPKWAPMTTRKARMPLRLPKKLVSRSKFRGSDEGAVPRYIHRLPVDGKIFGRKKKSPGGSVLIDDSGSMRFNQRDLKAIVTAAPAVNIAAYSGWHGSKGELVVLAQDGKYADLANDKDARPRGSDNLVDLPALEWLAEQPKPRIWVSDQEITLMDGDRTLAAKQVYRICKQKGINVVRNAGEARAVFEGKQEIYR